MTLLGPERAAAAVSNVMRGEKRVACKGNHNATVNVKPKSNFKAVRNNYALNNWSKFFNSSTNAYFENASFYKN